MKFNILLPPSKPELNMNDAKKSTIEITRKKNLKNWNTIMIFLDFHTFHVKSGMEIILKEKQFDEFCRKWSNLMRIRGKLSALLYVQTFVR